MIESQYVSFSLPIIQYRYLLPYYCKQGLGTAGYNIHYTSHSHSYTVLHIHRQVITIIRQECATGPHAMYKFIHDSASIYCILYLYNIY